MLAPPTMGQLHSPPHTTRAVSLGAPAIVQQYFEYADQGVEVVEDGLKEMSFGEFLVEQQLVDRFQLFCALQFQDRQPRMRLGECVAALGYASMGAVERTYARFNAVGTLTVD
jgi:hypothetical protein